MTVPPEAITAAARAYCLARFAYTGPYAADDGRDEHIRIDAETVAEEPWFLSLLEAAAPYFEAGVRERCARLAETHAAVWRDPAAKDTAGRRGAYVPFAGILRRDGRDRCNAETGFLAASVAVWREIDRLDAEPDGYHPTRMSVDLRQRERAAWECYRHVLDGA